MAKKGLGERLVVVEEYRDPKAAETAKTAKTTKDVFNEARENAIRIAFNSDYPSKAAKENAIRLAVDQGVVVKYVK